METSAEPAWVSLKDEEMLALRICDLGVRLQGSELEPRVNQLFDDLAARGVTLRPDCYLGDEWFSPDGRPRHRHPVLSGASASQDPRDAPDDGSRGRHAGMVPDAASA